MLESINRIGQVMGLKTVAEWVESDEIIEKLKSIGVDFVQGYALGYPLPMSEYGNNNPLIINQPAANLG